MIKLNIYFRAKYINMSGLDFFDRVLYSAPLLGVATAFFQFHKKAFHAACRLSDYIIYGEDVEERRRRRIEREEKVDVTASPSE